MKDDEHFSEQFERAEENDKRADIHIKCQSSALIMSLSKSTRLFQRFDNNKQYFGDFCSKLPSRNSITDSEKSQSSQNESLSQTSSNLDRNFTYWSIHRSKNTKGKSNWKLFCFLQILELLTLVYIWWVSPQLRKSSNSILRSSIQSLRIF